MRHPVRGSNVPRSGFAARLRVQYENAGDTATRYMADLEQNVYVRNLMEIGSHVTFFDGPTLAVETVSAFINAYHETHHASDQASESHDSIKVDHRDGGGTEHKARDGLEDSDYHLEQSADNTKDTATNNLDDISYDPDGKALSDADVVASKTDRGTEYQRSDSQDRPEKTASEQDCDTDASDVSQRNEPVAQEVQKGDRSDVIDKADSLIDRISAHDGDSDGAYEVDENVDEDFDSAW